MTYYLISLWVDKHGTQYWATTSEPVATLLKYCGFPNTISELQPKGES